MLKKTIKYKNFNDEEVSEDFYFNLSKADIIDLEINHPGGYSEHLTAVVRLQDNAKIMAEFKNLMKLSFGERSEDGTRFIKSDLAWIEFTSSNAYSELIMELLTDADAASQFMNGIIPENFAADMEKIAAKQEAADPPAEPKWLDHAEAVEMDGDELQSGLATGRYKLLPR